MFGCGCGDNSCLLWILLFSGCLGGCGCGNGCGCGGCDAREGRMGHGNGCGNGCNPCTLLALLTLCGGGFGCGCND